MKRLSGSFLLALLSGLLTLHVALAQTEDLRLSLSRDWGYGGFANDIQGLFSMHVRGPETLVKVEFFIDQTKIGEDARSPFVLQFTTDDYPLGEHVLSAIGTTSDGQELSSNQIVVLFVAASEGGKAAMRFVLPVLIVVLVAVLLGVVAPVLSGRGKLQRLELGAERRYGSGGGGICPRCQRPFALPFFSANLGLSKFARCPYCGKLGIVRLQSLAALREAEQAELEWEKAGIEAQDSEEEMLRKGMDDSKYQDSE
jgi:hypothetical protein